MNLSMQTLIRASSWFFLVWVERAAVYAACLTIDALL